MQPNTSAVAANVYVCVAPMPRVTVVNTTYQGTEDGGQGGQDPVHRWMEDVKEDKKEGEPAESHLPQR